MIPIRTKGSIPDPEIRCASGLSCVGLGRTGEAATLLFRVCKCRVQKRMDTAVTTQNTRGQSVYLAPGSVGTSRSCLFLGRPYLNLVLLPPPLPPVHTPPPPGNLTHKHTQAFSARSLSLSVIMIVLMFLTNSQFSSYLYNTFNKLELQIYDLYSRTISY